jgi:hypothetical protein
MILRVILTKAGTISFLSCIFSSTKLVIKAEQDLPGTEGEKGKRVGEGERKEK